MERLTEQALEFDKVKSYLTQLVYSPLGKVHVEGLTATTDKELIERQLAEVSELKEIRALHHPLPIEGFHDIREALLRSRVENSILDPAELRQIYDTLRAGRSIQKQMKEIEAPEYPLIREKVERLVIVEDLEKAIFRSVDDEGDILDSASPKLKQIRKDLRLAREKIQSWL
ncbi:endonuclease MutS2, partial [candidate division KSB3 bacterium]